MVGGALRGRALFCLTANVGGGVCFTTGTTIRTVSPPAAHTRQGRHSTKQASYYSRLVASEQTPVMAPREFSPMPRDGVNALRHPLCPQRLCSKDRVSIGPGQESKRKDSSPFLLPRVPLQPSLVLHGRRFRCRAAAPAAATRSGRARPRLGRLRCPLFAAAAAAAPAAAGLSLRPSRHTPDPSGHAPGGAALLLALAAAAAAAAFISRAALCLRRRLRGLSFPVVVSVDLMLLEGGGIRVWCHRRDLRWRTAPSTR